MPADRPREDNFLEVSSFLHKVLHRIPMRNAGDILLDDGSVVQYFRYAAEPQPKPTVVAKPLFLPVVTAGREQPPAQSRRDDTA